MINLTQTNLLHLKKIFQKHEHLFTYKCVNQIKYVQLSLGKKFWRENLEDLVIFIPKRQLSSRHI